MTAWTEPVAKRLGISDVGLAKTCRKHQSGKVLGRFSRKGRKSSQIDVVQEVS
jgi:hypothetical protein